MASKFHILYYSLNVALTVIILIMSLLLIIIIIHCLNDFVKNISWIEYNQEHLFTKECPDLLHILQYADKGFIIMEDRTKWQVIINLI